MSDEPTPKPEVDCPDLEGEPTPYRQVAMWLTHHPRLKAPSAVTVVLWVALCVLVAAVKISDSNATGHTRHNQNASACTIRQLVGRLRTSAEGSLTDPTTTPSAKVRAVANIANYDLVLRGQITSPMHLDCKAFLAKLSHAR